MNSKTNSLLKKFHKLVPRGIAEPLSLFVKSAHGAEITNTEDRRFIDFASGISTVNLGHTNKKVVQAIRMQAEKFIHTCMLVAPYKLYAQVAEELASLTPGKFAKKVFFANSGAEAVENAVKIARKATGRQGIVCFDHAFHGRTLLTLSLTSKVKPYKEGFGPFAPEVYKIPHPYFYNNLLSYIEGQFFKTVVVPKNIAAFIIEPVAGEGGILPCPSSFLRGLAKICKKYGILLIADEIQTGLGRTGKWFACEWSGIEPDIITVAKSLASGMPLSAVVGRRKIMDSVQPGGLGGTFGGNPVSLAAALATLQEMKRLNLPKRALQMEKMIEKTFREIAAASPIVKETRGLGAMWGLEMAETSPNRTKKLIKKLFKAGVIALSAGTYGNILRILPPLTISKSQLLKGLNIIKKIVTNH